MVEVEVRAKLMHGSRFGMVVARILPENEAKVAWSDVPGYEVGSTWAINFYKGPFGY